MDAFLCRVPSAFTQPAVASIMIMTSDPGSAEIDPIYTECVTFLQRGLIKARRGRKRSKCAPAYTIALNCGYSSIVTEVTVVFYNYY